MDISQISNIETLKAMAYDQILLLEQAQKNLGLINGRIQTLQIEEAKAQEETDKAKEAEQPNGEAQE